MVKVNAKPEGGIEFDEDFFLSWPDGYLRIKCACKAETRPRIPIAIHDTEAANQRIQPLHFSYMTGIWPWTKLDSADEVSFGVRYAFGTKRTSMLDAEHVRS